MRKQTIILLGFDIAIGHSVYVRSLLSYKGIEVIDMGGKLKEEPLTFPISNYDLSILDLIIDHQEPKIKKALWFQGSDKVDIKVSGKKQSSKYNQRRKLRNNKHKKS